MTRRRWVPRKVGCSFVDLLDFMSISMEKGRIGTGCRFDADFLVPEFIQESWFNCVWVVGIIGFVSGS